MRISRVKLSGAHLLILTGGLFSLCVLVGAAGVLSAGTSALLGSATASVAAFLYARRLWRTRRDGIKVERRLGSAKETGARENSQSQATCAAPCQHSGAKDNAGQTRADERLILLVEDDAISQRIVIRQLSALGYATHIASNGQEALDAFSFHAYALVLMDCRMPHMDGFEATRKIRMLDRARGRHTPVVALTASPTQDDRKRCVAAGMDGCVAKPIQRERLAELLASCLPPPVARHAAGGDMFNLPRQRDIFGDDRALRQQMLELFVDTSGPLITRLGSAIADEDFDEIGARTHQLAGACASIGLDELTALTHAAERAARERDLRTLAQIHRTMTPAFQKLCDFLHQKKAERS